MSMLPLIATMLIVGAEPSAAPLNELVDRWDNECATVSDTPECAGLAAEVELGLYDLVRKLSLNRQPIDREVLRAAADSDLPALAKFGVSMLGTPQSQLEADILLRALDHPVLAVRYIAARNLGDVKDPRWQALQTWWTGWTLASSANGPEDSLIPDPQPSPDMFAMTSFNQLAFHYYGSDRERAMFTTSEPAESFVKRLSAKRRVLSSLDAMQEQMNALQPEMDAVQKEMEVAGEKNDMDRLNAAMKRYEALGKKMGGMSALAANPMADSKTVILIEDPATRRATATVTVQRDDKLKSTVLLFWREGGWRS
jgi:hypothetical protein